MRLAPLQLGWTFAGAAGTVGTVVVDHKMTAHKGERVVEPVGSSVAVAFHHTGWLVVKRSDQFHNCYKNAARLGHLYHTQSRDDQMPVT